MFNLYQCQTGEQCIPGLPYLTLFCLFEILALDDRDAAGLAAGLPAELARQITALLAELGEG